MTKRARGRDGVSRRDFLAVGGISLMGLPVAERLAEARRRGAHQTRACILILMNGGPSPWETFDPKPDAPREIRGPLRAISTAVPGVQFCESLPELARRADQLTVVRSLYHTAAPTHEPGFQLLQAGRLAHKGVLPPSLGVRVASELPSAWDVPAYALLNGGLHATGTRASPGDAAATVSRQPGPLVVDAAGSVVAGESVSVGKVADIMTDLDSESRDNRDRYGDSDMGRRLLQSRQLIEQGVRFVTVNTFSRLEGERTWDAHGCPTSAPATVFDYCSSIGPQFDRAAAALLDDLTDRGLLESTLVVCAGEIGRHPLLNAGGGREHWTMGFSGLLFGGDTTPGAVLGATTRHGSEIQDAPVPLENLAEQMRLFLGLTTAANDQAATVAGELARVTV